MEVCRQYEEALSWRLMTEMLRRFPDVFRLIEAHPGGGLGDCLALINKRGQPTIVMDVNRNGGSVHINAYADGTNAGYEVISDWQRKMTQSSASDFLDELAQALRLEVPHTLPPSTQETIVYRFIADFLTHAVGRLSRWECRNGYCDTSGFGAGKRVEWFEKFPGLQNNEDLRHSEPFIGEYAYNFWFLLQDDEPKLCLDTAGMAYRLDGKSHDLTDLYAQYRRIWPMIFRVAGDLLP